MIEKNLEIYTRGAFFYGFLSILILFFNTQAESRIYLAQRSLDQDCSGQVTMEPNFVLSNEAFAFFRSRINRITGGDFSPTAGYNIVALPRAATYNAENQPDDLSQRTSNPREGALHLKLLAELFNEENTDAEKLAKFETLHSYLRQRLIDRAAEHGVIYRNGKFVGVRC